MAQKTEIQGMRKKIFDNRILFSYFDSLINKEKINMHRIESSHVSLQTVYSNYIDFKKQITQGFKSDEIRTDYFLDSIEVIKNLYSEYLEIKVYMDKKTNQKFDFYIQEILISMQEFGFDYKKSL